MRTRTTFGNLEGYRKYAEDLLAEAEHQNSGYYKCQTTFSQLLVAITRIKPTRFSGSQRFCGQAEPSEKLYGLHHVQGLAVLDHSYSLAGSGGMRKESKTHAQGG